MQKYVRVNHAADLMKRSFKMQEINSRIENNSLGKPQINTQQKINQEAKRRRKSDPTPKSFYRDSDQTNMEQ